MVTEGEAPSKRVSQSYKALDVYVVKNEGRLQCCSTAVVAFIPSTSKKKSLCKPDGFAGKNFGYYDDHIKSIV